MKVLFVSGEFPPMQGGVGDYTCQIGLALSELGCQVHVVTSIHGQPVEGLTVHPVVERWDWSCWRTLLHLIERHQPDIIHIQYQAAAYAMHPAINLVPRRLRWQPGLTSSKLSARRPRTVVTFHDLKVPYLFPKAGPVRWWVISDLARHNDAVIVTNRADWEQLQHELGAPPALIPIGSNIAAELPDGYDRQAWRARWGAGPDDLLLCFFGFINDRKGVDTLLHALYFLLSDSGKPGRSSLLFIGGQTGSSDPTNVAYLAYIRTLIAELGLEARVHWTGYIPAQEVSANFLAADMCVLPFRDGVSLLHGTLHAALVHGVPIITTMPRLPLPELEDGKNVLLIPPEQPQTLASAIARLASDPDLCRSLGDGAEVLSRQFRWDRIAADTLALYRTLVSDG
jgi:glycosyltransferase involved in cell wall biosynthesis